MKKHTQFGVEKSFFEELREGSRVKQRIVIDYFIAYCRKMTPGPREKVGYADLFAGPGVYLGGRGPAEKSIPVLICEAVVTNELFRRKVHLWFNDADRRNVEQLRKAIYSIPGIQTLRYEPRIDNKVVDATWAKRIERLRVPTLMFFDPCGYKGLSLPMVTSALKGFGHDCIFFFNYSRINMKLDLEVMNTSIDEFFEPDRAAALRIEIQNRSAAEREGIIVSAVTTALEAAGAVALPFRFKSDNGRTSHHLVFASKNVAAAGMMKRILRSASSSIREGVGSSEHDPREQHKTGSLFSGLYAVEERLLAIFAGRRLQFGTLLELEAHTSFTDSNYRDAVLKLEQESRIAVDPPAERRPYQAGRTKRTLPKQTWLAFPERSQHG